MTASFLAGFVAAEGTFGVSGASRRFRFAVGLGATDSTTCYLFRDFLGCGNVYRSPRRKPHYDNECTFAVQSLLDHFEVTIPFMDVHLPESYKRSQYLAWREKLLHYWEHDARRVRLCVVDGCDQPRRAHELCRRHLYAARGA
ncbi:MAG: LAGLIDADG family homing endonuclease [Acidimicrobiia bacterium]